MSDTSGEVAAAALFIGSLMFMQAEYGTMRACKALSDAVGNDYVRVATLLKHDIQADNRKPEDRPEYHRRLRTFDLHFELAARLGTPNMVTRAEARDFYERQHDEWTAVGCYTTLFLGEIWYGGDIAAAYPDLAL